MSKRRPFAALGNRASHVAGRVQSKLHESTELSVDVLDGEDTYRVVFDAPGASLDDVQVAYLDGAVRIEIERTRPTHDEFQLRFPGRPMTLVGESPLPDDASVDPEAATAILSDAGTITVEVPKVDASTDVEPIVAE